MPARATHTSSTLTHTTATQGRGKPPVPESAWIKALIQITRKTVKKLFGRHEDKTLCNKYHTNIQNYILVRTGTYCHDHDVWYCYTIQRWGDTGIWWQHTIWNDVKLNSPRDTSRQKSENDCICANDTCWTDALTAELCHTHTTGQRSHDQYCDTCGHACEQWHIWWPTQKHDSHMHDSKIKTALTSM